MREKNDLTKNLKRNNSRISIRVRADSLYVTKKNSWEGIQVDCQTSAAGRKNKHHSVLS